MIPFKGACALKRGAPSGVIGYIVEFSSEIIYKSMSRKLPIRGHLKASIILFIYPGAFVPYIICYKANENHPIDVNVKEFFLGRGHLTVSKATAVFTNSQESFLPSETAL